MWFLFIVPCCPFVNCTQKVNKKERFDLAKKSRASSAERKRAALCSSALSMNISTLRAAFFNDPTQPRGVFFLPRGGGGGWVGDDDDGDDDDACVGVGGVCCCFIWRATNWSQHRERCCV